MSDAFARVILAILDTHIAKNRPAWLFMHTSVHITCSQGPSKPAAINFTRKTLLVYLRINPAGSRISNSRIFYCPCLFTIHRI